MINIPIYRALKLGTKDEYVEGYLMRPQYDVYKIQPNEYDIMPYIIDSLTLAISFDGGNTYFNNFKEIDRKLKMGCT